MISVLLLSVLEILLSFAPILQPLLAEANFEGSRSHQTSSSMQTLIWTAIVYATKYLSNCKAIRLEHLMQRAPPSMHVWFFHNHDALNEKEKGRSMRYLKYFQDQYVLKSLNQERTGTMGIFDGSSHTGTSKSTFLQFVMTHPVSDYAWIVEDDVIMTGGWSSLFVLTI